MWGAVGRVLALFVPLAALLGIAAMLPFPSRGAPFLTRPVHRVVTESYVFEPDIAVDPTNPNHVAATVASADNLHCSQGCTITLLLATSTDGGLLFNPTATAFIHQGLPSNIAGSIHPTTFSNLRADKTWLTIAPRSGVLYLTYTVRNTGTPAVIGRLVQRSTDSGKTWTETALPFDSQGAVLPQSAGDVALASWTQASGPLALGKVDVHVARSSDGGKTFSAPSLIDAAWGSLGEAAGAGADYLAYAAGEQQAERLVVTSSRDGGTSRCTDPAQFQQTASGGLLRYEPWIDPCTYNVYYTFSKDAGKTWAAATRLNQQPIVGNKAVRTPADRSRLGEYVGVASTDDDALLLWIATNAAGTEADTTRIPR